MKYGYTISRSQEHGYSKLYLEVYAHDGATSYSKWSPILTVKYQADSTYNFWYGFNVYLNSNLYHGEFATAVRLMSRIDKLCFSANPDVVINTLNLTRLVRDERTSELVTVKEYEKTEGWAAYNFYFDGTYTERFLAKDTVQAYAHVQSQAESGYYSRSNAIGQNVAGWKIERTNDSYRPVFSLEYELSL